MTPFKHLSMFSPVLYDSCPAAIIHTELIKYWCYQHHVLCTTPFFNVKRKGLSFHNREKFKNIIKYSDLKCIKSNTQCGSSCAYNHLCIWGSPDVFVSPSESQCFMWVCVYLLYLSIHALFSLQAFLSHSVVVMIMIPCIEGWHKQL